MKNCWKCQSIKSLNSFYVDKSRADGLQPLCKECQKNTHIDPIKRKATTDKYRFSNLDKCREASRLSKQKNPILGKEWAKSNKEKVTAYKALNRAKRKKAIGKYTGEQVSNLFTLQNGKCACCKSNLKKGFHRDHIQALACGGTNDITNIQLLCKLCNLRKGAKDSIKFMQNLGYLL